MKRYITMRDAALFYVGRGEYRLFGIPINHPDLSIKQGASCVTATIIRKDFKKKEFETRNSIYRIWSWSKAQQAEWQRIAARALKGPIAGYGISQRL